MDLKNKKTGFTLVELLTVLAIMALLVGILVPSVNVARNMARKAKQKGQFTAIDMAIISFRNDNGDYPPSDNLSVGMNYCGAQKLAEALVGWDLRGFHPDSNWVSDGLDGLGSPIYIPDTLHQREGPYLEVATSNAFMLETIFGANTGYLAGKTYVLCDSFNMYQRQIEDQVYKVGNPILYYRAYVNRYSFAPGATGDNRYDFFDNQNLVIFVNEENGGDDNTFSPEIFYGFNKTDDGEIYKIIDQRILNSTGGFSSSSAERWPHRADSYILISAGPDGLYGTSDDMTNF